MRVVTGVDKGGGQPPPIAGQKFFLVKTEGLSSLPPAKPGRACYDNPTGRGYFYQMPNMSTCKAYLTDIRKLCSKNLVHKSVNFEAQNALKLTYEAPLISKNFRGLYLRAPVTRGRGGPRQFTFLATPLDRSQVGRSRIACCG